MNNIKYIAINSLATSAESRDYIVHNYLKIIKTIKGNVSVIDVGGSANLRVEDYTTHVLDFKPLNNKNIHYFSGDMELYDTWEPIFDYVDKNGKFDFSICSHTLEDLNAPKQVMINLQKISNAGLIAFPSKYMEMKKWEGRSGYSLKGIIIIDGFILSTIVL